MSIYKSYDQAALDIQFNNRLHVPDYAKYLDRWTLLGRQTEQELQVEKDLRYGELPRETLDIYPSPKPDSKTLVFIHGGYWQMFDKAMFHFIANGFHPYGITTVLLAYPLAPEASLDKIVSSCRKAILWLYQNISNFHGDREQIYVAGHSAGGHLAAMLMASDWSSFAPTVPVNILKGICSVSGLFDLVPVHYSYVNQVLKMDMDTAVRNSPIKFQPPKACPMLVAVGQAETTEFNEQSKDFYTCWKGKGADVQFLQLPRLNHYSILESITDKSAALHKAVCQLMKIHP